MPNLAGGRIALLVALLLLVIPLAFFWQMIVGGQEPLAPDTQAVRPLSVWAQEARAELGETPLWCPMILSGMPSYGSFTHTPSSSLDLTRWLRTPFRDARGARYYLSLVLGALALYGLLLLRRRHPLSALGGALVFVMTPYMLGLVAAGHSTKLHALCLAPLVFLAIELLLQKRSLTAAALLAAAVALQLWNNHPQISYYTLLLGGIYTALILLLDRPPRWRGRGLWAGLALGLLALLIAGALVMEPYGAVLEYTPHSIRGGSGAVAVASESGAGWDYATAWSYPPAEMIAFLFPAWFGLEGATYWGALPFTQSTHYFGVTALLIALLALALTSGRRKWIWVLLWGVVLLIGFGRNLPLLFWPAYKLLPMFDRFRVPSMIYALMPLFVALLAAAGLDAVRRGGAWVTRAGSGSPAPARARRAGGKRRPSPGPSRESRPVAPHEDAPIPRWGQQLMARWTIVTAVLIALLLLWLLLGAAITSGLREAGGFVRGGEAQRFGEQLGWLAGQRAELLRESVTWGLLLLALGALVIEARRRRILPGIWAVAILLGLLLADLWTIDRKFYHPVPRARSEAILSEDAIVRALREAHAGNPAPFRVAPLTASEFATNRYAGFGLESVGGYQPAKLRCYDDLIRSGAIYSLPVLSMLNACYLITERPLPPDEFPQLARVPGPGGGELFLHENPAALPRAWFVSEVRAIDDPGRLLAQVAAPDFRPAAIAYLPAAEAADLPAACSAGEVLALAAGTQRLELEVRVAGPEPGLLVCSEVVYPPGWVARIDGAEVPIRTANHLLRALRVPPGEHHVELAAVSPGLARGRIASRIAAGVLAAMLILGWAVRRRTAAGGPAATGEKSDV